LDEPIYGFMHVLLVRLIFRVGRYKGRHQTCKVLILPVKPSFLAENNEYQRLLPKIWTKLEIEQVENSLISN